MVPVVLAAIAAVALAAHPASSAEVAYFEVPRGAHPHDVAPAPDGGVWYTAQFQGALGILNPKTGQATQIALGAGSSPHGVIVGPDRAAWITDGGQNAIARVDPATKAVKLFPLPKEFPGANLNTATFDRKGILWFTGQSGVYGRVDPSSGKVEAWKAPKGTGPYGITTTPNGEVWYASLAGDHIAKIDTVSGDALMVPPPKPGVGPRRIWSDSKGLLWVSFWNTGEIGRYDPINKESLESAEEQGRVLRHICRQQRQDLGHRLRRQRHYPVRSGDRGLRELPERQARCFGPAIAWPAGRGLGCGVRRRPAGRDQGLVTAGRHDGPHSASRSPRYSLFSRWWRVIGGRPRSRPCRRNKDRAPHQ